MSNRWEADADEVRRLTLTAFVGGEVDELAERLAIMRLVGVNPARELLELAADLFLMTGVTRTRPLDLVDLADRHLADVPVRGTPPARNAGTPSPPPASNQKTPAGGDSTTCGPTPSTPASPTSAPPPKPAASPPRRSPPNSTTSRSSARSGDQRRTCEQR